MYSPGCSDSLYIVFCVSHHNLAYFENLRSLKPPWWPESSSETCLASQPAWLMTEPLVGSLAQEKTLFYHKIRLYVLICVRKLIFSVFFSVSQGLESCLKGPDNYNSQVLIEATVIALTKLQPLLNKVRRQKCTQPLQVKF